MSRFRFLRRRRTELRSPPTRTSSFFVDSIGDSAWHEPAEPGRRVSDFVIVAIVLAAAAGAAGLIGWLQRALLTGS